MGRPIPPEDSYPVPPKKGGIPTKDSNTPATSWRVFITSLPGIPEETFVILQCKVGCAYKTFETVIALDWGLGRGGLSQ